MNYELWIMVIAYSNGHRFVEREEPEERMGHFVISLSVLTGRSLIPLPSSFASVLRSSLPPFLVLEKQSKVPKSWTGSLQQSLKDK